MTRLVRKIWNGFLGLLNAVPLNLRSLSYSLQGKKVLLFQLFGATQGPHILSLLDEFSENKNVVCVVLTPPKEIQPTRDLMPNTLVSSIDSTWFVLFWDSIIAVDQGMRLPFISFLAGQRICMFHGQPSKGNTYLKFNHRQFDHLFFYGETMQQKFLRERQDHPEWQNLELHEIGQPKSDALVNLDRAAQRSKSRQSMQIEENVKVVLYAPSFESCASFRSSGEEIIEGLISTGSHLIVKPHPTFYRVNDPNDPTYTNVPHREEWRTRAVQLEQAGTVTFPIDKQIPSEVAIPAADLLVTDHSGIAFDAILFDIPVIYFHADEFFTKYLPERFGVDGQRALNDITCNGGRDAGDVVYTIDELKAAVGSNLQNPERNKDARNTVRNTLLFNPGGATKAATAKILELVNR